MARPNGNQPSNKHAPAHDFYTPQYDQSLKADKRTLASIDDYRQFVKEKTGFEPTREQVFDVFANHGLENDPAYVDWAKRNGSRASASAGTSAAPARASSEATS